MADSTPVVTIGDAQPKSQADDSEQKEDDAATTIENENLTAEEYQMQQQPQSTVRGSTGL